MDHVWELLKIALIGVLGLAALILILLSMPQSRLRKILFNIFSKLCYAVTALLIVYIISPADLIPDIIPLLGQVDDVVAAITAVFSGTAGIILASQGKKSVPGLIKLKGKKAPEVKQIPQPMSESQ